MVPKGMLTFLGSIYKEGAKTTSGTLVCLFERRTARKNISFFQKHCVPNLECRILSQEHDTVGKPKKIHGITGCRENNCKHFLDFRSSMTSGSLSQGLTSALPKYPRKVNNPFGTTPYKENSHLHSSVPAISDCMLGK